MLGGCDPRLNEVYCRKWVNVGKGDSVL
jgi:hypothetical protein